MGISVGLVGLGAFGRAFADLFKSHPLVDRVALCDREPDRVDAFARKESFQDKFSLRDAYTSFDDILAADLDALVVITQPWLHAEQAVRAMEAGKHVYSAVPVVCLPDGDEILAWCDRIVETCRRTGMLYMLGETTYYKPQTMYCRTMASGGAFGRFVFAEAEYFHDVDLPACNLRDVHKARTSSRSGQEWLPVVQKYLERGVADGPMHYPTHSTSGPISVMKAHATRVCAWGYPAPAGDDYFRGTPFADETALFRMSNGATMRICEYRLVGVMGREMFNILGTEGAFYGEEESRGKSTWVTKTSATPLTIEQMRTPLPQEVYRAFASGRGPTGSLGPRSRGEPFPLGGTPAAGASTPREAELPDVYGGHGGSHAYLVHEFVDAVAHERQPTTNAWEAVRYMVPGVMAHKSALRDGELLKVPDWGDAPH